MPRLVRALALACALVAAPAAHATWSIIMVDTETGEVAIGSATCLTSFDLARLLPVVVVNKGAAAAQSAIDNGAINRKKIWDQLFLCTPAGEIIDIAKQGDPFKASRQYGIVENSPTAAGFTGNAAFGYKEDRQGTVGSVTYSIQGNVLAGVEVMDAMEAAIVGSNGPLAERLMLTMEAARLTGGDGRCWCSENQPASCEPEDFDPDLDKTAHIGFMIVARAGDEDGVCTAGQGCANGDYYMRLNVIFQPVDAPDPVLQLRDQYDQFVLAQSGHPDGVTSTFVFDDDEVVAQGGELRTFTVTVRDIDGAVLDANALSVTVEHAAGSAGSAVIETVEMTPVGEVVVTLRAGDVIGTDVFDVRVSDAAVTATVAPQPTLANVASLSVGEGASVTAGGTVEFALRGPDSLAGGGYFLALSASGSEPGVVLAPGVVLPLGVDRLYIHTIDLAALGYFVGNPGPLDADSRAAVVLRVPPGDFAFLAGLEITAAWAFSGTVPFASNAVTFELRR